MWKSVFSAYSVSKGCVLTLETIGILKNITITISLFVIWYLLYFAYGIPTFSQSYLTRDLSHYQLYS